MKRYECLACNDTFDTMEQAKKHIEDQAKEIFATNKDYYYNHGWCVRGKKNG